MRLVVGLVAKVVLLLRKTLFKASETFNIRKGILKCSSNLVVYLIECKSRSKQYVGSTVTPFCTRFNNYKSVAGKVSKVYTTKCNVYQENFHRHSNSWDPL